MYRKCFRLGKGSRIYTRLISSVIIDAGKMLIKKGALGGQFALANVITELIKGRGVIGLASNSNHAPPGQAFELFNSYKTMDLRYS